MTEPAIRAAIFDIGNVVIRIDLSAVPRRLAEMAGVSVEKAAAALLDGGRRDLMELGQLSMQEYYCHVVGLLGKPISYSDFDRAWNSIYFGVCDGIEELLIGLRKTIRVVALTNTGSGHADWWRREYARTVGHFEKIFMSYEMCVGKPRRECFERVLDYLSLLPVQAVFIDDYTPNVSAAVAMGMKGIVAKSTGQVARELTGMGVNVKGA